MSAHLVIHDSPMPQWWLSPDIWVVPGNDPNGPPGSPIAGTPAYMWARVSNTGNTPASGTRIDFCWANPAAQVIVGVATQIGSAFVDLAPGDTQEVLCLVPWLPVIVNGGHECVLAVAHGQDDSKPLPDPLPNGFPFDPPSHEQIAQLNLSVLESGMRSGPMPIRVVALPREDKLAHLTVQFGKQVDERVLAQLGLHGLRPADEQVVRLSLSTEARCDDHPEAHGHAGLEVKVPRGHTTAVFANVDARQLPPRRYQLVHVIESVAGKVVGGVSYLLVNRAHPLEEQAS